MKFKVTRDWLKSFFVMIIAVIVMGMCVSLLVMCDMGTDPCSAMNYGISHKLGMSFGNYQLLSNFVLLILVIIFEKKLICLIIKSLHCICLDTLSLEHNSLSKSLLEYRHCDDESGIYLSDKIDV